MTEQQSESQEQTQKLAEEQTHGTQAPQASELKVVLVLGSGRASIGIQKPNCDPYLMVLPQAALEDVLASVPEALAQAEALWRQRQRFPAYARPAAPAATTPVASTARKPESPSRPKLL